MILTTLLTVLIPRHESMDRTYQTSMVTYPANQQSLDMTSRPQEATLRIGGKLAQGTFMHWDRFHLGFPISAVNIDLQRQTPVVQARIKFLDCIASVIAGLCLAILPLGVWFVVARRRRHFLQR